MRLSKAGFTNWSRTVRDVRLTETFEAKNKDEEEIMA